MTWLVIIFFCFLGVREDGLELAALDSAVIIELAPDGLPPLANAHLSAALIDDADDTLAQMMAWRDASKPALEPLIKRYMYVVERLTQRSVAANSNERQRLAAEVRALEAQKEALLTPYRRQIRELLELHTLKRLEMTAASLPMRFDAPPGRYRLHVILTVETTQFHWFEAIQLQGGDRLAIRLTRENLKNPDWTDVNWWSFMNLDFSKHHAISHDNE